MAQISIEVTSRLRIINISYFMAFSGSMSGGKSTRLGRTSNANAVPAFKGVQSADSYEVCQVVVCSVSVRGQ
jgi:hypothetical protein